MARGKGLKGHVKELGPYPRAMGPLLRLGFEKERQEALSAFPAGWPASNLRLAEMLATP